MLESFRKRLFLDAANIVIEDIREGLKNTWIKLFTDPQALPDRETARQALLSRPEWGAFREKAGEHTKAEFLRGQFDAVVDDLTGGTASIQFGRGTWLERMDAKPVFNRVVNEWTTLEDSGIRASQKLRAVVRALVRRIASEPKFLPDDLREVRDLILARTK